MDHAALIPFGLALMAVTAAPGPMVAVIVTRALVRDTAGAAAFAAGVCLGDLLAILAIAVGIGAWIEGSGAWLSVLKLGGVAYLLWLAIQIWRDSTPDRSEARTPLRRGWIASVGAGAALCLGNPATFLFYLLLLPGVAPEGLGEVSTLGSILLVSMVAVGGALAAMILLAAHLQRILVTPLANAVFGRTMAALLALTSVSLLAA